MSEQQPVKLIDAATFLASIKSWSPEERREVAEAVCAGVFGIRSVGLDFEKEQEKILAEQEFVAAERAKIDSTPVKYEPRRAALLDSPEVAKYVDRLKSEMHRNLCVLIDHKIEQVKGWPTPATPLVSGTKFREHASSLGFHFVPSTKPEYLERKMAMIGDVLASEATKPHTISPPGKSWDRKLTDDEVKALYDFVVPDNFSGTVVGDPTAPGGYRLEPAGTSPHGVFKEYDPAVDPQLTKAILRGDLPESRIFGGSLHVAHNGGQTASFDLPAGFSGTVTFDPAEPDRLKLKPEGHSAYTIPDCTKIPDKTIVADPVAVAKFAFPEGFAHKVAELESLGFGFLDSETFCCARGWHAERHARGVSFHDPSGVERVLVRCGFEGLDDVVTVYKAQERFL